MTKNVLKASSEELMDDLYRHDYQPRLPDGQIFEIPADGSLGLLATGYTGLVAWRKMREMKK